MTDAPERIWLDWRPGLAVTSGPLASKPRTEYIRSDTAAAMVAEARNAALEEAARVADEARKMRERLFSENGGFVNAARSLQAEEIAAAIRALKDAAP